MSSVSRTDSRKVTKNRAVLMRTAATALIAASPMLYSGAAASVGGIQLTAPTVKSAKKADVTTLVAGGNLQLTAPGFFSGTEAGQLAAIGNFKLGAPILQGFAAPKASSFASQPVQNLLAVPMSAQSGPGTFGASTMSISTMAVVGPIVETATGTDPIDIDNPDTIIDAPASAIEANAELGDITIVNSGSISGVNGIVASTSELNLANETPDYSATWHRYDYYSRAYVYDTNGNLVLNPNFWSGAYFKTEVDEVTEIFNLDANTSNAKININNSGSVGFSGLYGVKASNETGDSIDITNSGDILATSDTERRVGIYADATVPSRIVGDTVRIQDGQFTYDNYGRLLQGFTPNLDEQTTTTIIAAKDDGSVRIENSGSIDMGAVHRDQWWGYYGPSSEGITVIGTGRNYVDALDSGVTWTGGIDIVNSGTVKVGDFSRGITAVADGGINILNSGTVEIGNKSDGIIIGSSPLYGFQNGDAYRASGDNLIVNTGDIIGGLTLEEALASDNAYAFGSTMPGFEKTYVVGIRAEVRNTNNEYYARYEQFKEEQAYYAGIFGEQYFPPHAFENTHNYTTAIINQGDIILKDGGRGIVGSAQYGELIAINSGTISVGDGTGIFDSNLDIVSAGIRLSNFANNGLGDLYAKNESSGIIVTGDMGVGMNAQQWVGNRATVINEGSVTVGNGVVGTDYLWVNDYTELKPYDRLFKSIGLEAVVRGAPQGYTYLRNSGTVTTGDLSLGMRMYANSVDILVSGRSAGLALNEGAIITGDNSIGIQASGGTSFVVHNTAEGTISIGDKDISGYNMHPQSTAPSFELSGYGIFASAGMAGFVRNDGRIETGNGTIGIYNGARQNPFDFNYLSYTAQGETGVISTGDNAIGVKTHAGLYSTTVNAGTISVGDSSVGLEASSGFHYTQLLDTIQYGGCHKYNYNNGAGCTADTVTTGYTYDWTPPNDYANYVGGTHTEFTQEVARPGLVQVDNSGIIETGDNSVGVRLAGITDLDYVSYRYVSTPDNYGGRSNVRTRVEGTVETDSYVFFRNFGTIRTGANSTGVEITGRGLPVGPGNYAPQMVNYGAIDAGRGVAIAANVATGIDSKIYNAGTIVGDILFGDGDDLLLNGQNIDPSTGQVLSIGNIFMDGHTIDFGGGTNAFRMQNAAISVVGGDDNLITGDNLTVEFDYGEIDARDDFIAAPASLAGMSTMALTPMSHDVTNFSTLTINGDVSGTMRFATDVGPDGESDVLNITGDVLAGSNIGFILNPVHQLKGEIEIRPMNIGGSNNADVIDVAGVSGLYADSLIEWETNYEASTGDVVISAIFGLGHMGTAANAAAVSAGNWLASSLSSYSDRNIHAYTGRKGEGLAIWGRAFQDEGRIDPDSDLQDLSFNQITSGIQAGVQWSRDIGAGRVSISPMATYGTVEANLNANTSSSRGHPWAVGISANYVIPGSFYVDATYQRMKANIDLKTPGTVTQATGETKVHGNGYNLEVGYSHKLSNGLVIEPQLQLTHTRVDLDDFQTSDGIYGLDDIDGKTSTVRAGVSAYKVFETSHGAITPMASLSYINSFDGKTELSSNAVDFDSDTSGAGYKAEVGVLGRYNAWDFAAKVAFSETSSSGSIMSPSLSARYSFGGDAAAKTAAAAQIPEVTEATVKFAEAGNLAAGPLATAAAADQGAPVVSAAYAQTGAEPTEEDKKEEQPTEATPELEPEQAAEPAAEESAEGEADVVVTGSIIRRKTNSEATPMSVVDSEEMATKGLLTVGDVMKSFTENKGYTEGKASNLLGRFTFGAEEVNFRGLGTGRTLVLVNGRRIADYPLPFGGEQNGADLGTIPYSAIAKVEYLASGASATYGSDAVGGVVNIITKRDMEQTSASLTTGIYQQGFGEMARASLSTGNSFARGSYTIGVEGSFSNKILASQVDYFKDHAPFVAGMIQIDENTASGMNSTLPPSSCAPLGFEYENDQCVEDVTNTISLSPKAWQVSGFFDGRYDLTDDIELFATGMVSKNRNKTKSNVLFWQGVVADEDGSAASFITRGFSDDELGTSDVEVDQLMWTGVVGAKGRFDLGGKPWYWDTAFSYGSYKSTQKQTLLKEEGIKNWILAGATTVIDDPNQQYTYIVDSPFYDNQLVDNVVRQVQPSDVDGLVGRSHMDGKASSSMLSATLNGDIGDLGFLFRPAKVAIRAEYGHQMTEIDPDQRTLDTTGNGWYNIGLISSKGTRDRWAIGAEMDASVLSNLDLTLAGRYDHYSDASDITGRFTGSAKFLYRPNDWLKVRGGFAQSFRAPDMFNIYGVSQGYTYVPDFAAPGCDGGTGSNCQFYPVLSTRQADPNLTEEHGTDMGLGVIFSPVKNFTVTVDWYKIKLKDLVITESPYDVMFKEWQCNEGDLDPSSQLCQDIYDRVIRNGFGVVEEVIVQPINQDNLTRSGFDIRAQYSFESETLGAFTADLSYSKVLKFDLTRFDGDDSIDLKYGEPGASQPGNSLGASLSWFKPLTTGKAISAGLYVSRQGRVKNYDHTQFMEPFYNVNMTVGYQLSTKTSARFSVNNLLNAKPVENGSGFWPGYWAHLQGSEALGRSFFLTIGHSFN